MQLVIRRLRDRITLDRQNSFMENDLEGQLSVSGKRMCTILANCLEDEACPVKVWLGKLTVLDMTPLG